MRVSKVTIYCCGCTSDVSACLTKGSEVYPHRADLAQLTFWKCDTCGNFVGCHKGSYKPLGCIPTPELKNARMHIHAILDPLWQEGHISRQEAYRRISKALGVSEYHTAEIRSLEDARQVYRIVLNIRRELKTGGNE
jgi:hypothetical protein